MKNGGPIAGLWPLMFAILEQEKQVKDLMVLNKSLY